MSVYLLVKMGRFHEKNNQQTRLRKGKKSLTRQFSIHILILVDYRLFILFVSQEPVPASFQADPLYAEAPAAVAVRFSSFFDIHLSLSLPFLRSEDLPKLTSSGLYKKLKQVYSFVMSLFYSVDQGAENEPYEGGEGEEEDFDAAFERDLEGGGEEAAGRFFFFFFFFTKERCSFLFLFLYFSFRFCLSLKK